MKYDIQGNVRFAEKPIHTLPPQGNIDGIKRNIRIYKNTVYDLELDLKSLKWFNFIKKRDLNYKINEYNKLILQEEYKIKLREEDGLK